MCLTGLFVSVIATSVCHVPESEDVLLPGGAAYLENDFELFRAPVIHVDSEGHRNGQAHKGDS